MSNKMNKKREINLCENRFNMKIRQIIYSSKSAKSLSREKTKKNCFFLVRCYVKVSVDVPVYSSERTTDCLLFALPLEICCDQRNALSVKFSERFRIFPFSLSLSLFSFYSMFQGLF